MWVHFYLMHLPLSYFFGGSSMFIVFNEDGQVWAKPGCWGGEDTMRFFSMAGAVRSLHEAGEDIDNCAIIEDFAEMTEYVDFALSA